MSHPGRKAKAEQFGPAAELFDRIMQMTDNAGATDSPRLELPGYALPGIYAKAAEEFAKDCSSAGDPSLASAARARSSMSLRLYQPQYRLRKFFVRCDVTENSRSWSQEAGTVL